MARSRWIPDAKFHALLTLCQPENAEALRLSLDYGLRIGDVLRMPASVVQSGRWSFKEEKTGKRRRVRLSETHRRALSCFAGKFYAFEHRLDPHKHRTRQAVYKDIKGLANRLGLRYVSPHSARKIYAVNRYHQSGNDINKVQKLLNHSDPTVTVLYALADQMQGNSRGAKGRRLS